MVQDEVAPICIIPEGLIKGLYINALHWYLSRLRLALANRVAALASRDGILWIQGIPNVKNR